MQIYKPSINQKLNYLENENVETTNVLNELIYKIDNIDSRLKILESYILSDGK